MNTEEDARTGRRSTEPAEPGAWSAAASDSQAPIFRLLGPVEVVYAGRRLDVGGPKQRCVLASLLVARGHLVSMERLIDTVWGLRPPESARRAVQAYVSHLRRVLTDACAGAYDMALIGRDGGYLLDVDPDRVDLHRFRRLAGCDDEQALSDALALWSGPVLGGIGDSPLRAQEAPRLEEERLATVERRATLRLAAGDAAAAIPELLEVVAEHPLRESAHGLLMRALHRAGRLGEALTVFADIRARLREELGTEPSAELAAVHQELLEGADSPASEVGEQLDAGSEEGGDVPPLPVPSQLPSEPANFTGRRHEVEWLTRGLVEPAGRRSGVRAVAITGHGGVGKTALTLHVAHRLHSRFPGGRLYADLRGSQHSPAIPADVLASFLHAFGIEGERIPDDLDDRAALFRSLTFGRDVLVVLDDARDEEQVRPLLPGNPECAVLITSRRRLGGLVDIRGLSLDELSESDALRLLSELVGYGRIAAEPAVAERIVRVAAGLPLALRLVAGRLVAHPSWALVEFADRLESASRLDELRYGDTAVRGSLELSYRNLDPDSARAFRMVAATGVPRPDSDLAAAVLGVSRQRADRLLTDLVDLHLLQEPSPGGYRYHDLLRAFALDQAHAEDPEQDRHDAVYQAFALYAGTAVAALTTMMPQLPLHGLGLDHVARPVEFADAGAAGRWLEAHHITTTDLGHRLLDGPIPEGSLYPLGGLVVYLGNYAEVGGYWSGWEELGVRVLDRAQQDGDRPTQMRVRMACGGAAMRRRDPDTAEAMLLPAIADAVERGDQTVQGRLLAMLGMAFVQAGRIEPAEQRLSEALEAHRTIRNHRGMASTHVHLADLHILRAQYADAIEQARQAVRLEAGMESSEPFLRLSAFQAIGEAYVGLARHQDAVQYLERAHGLATEYSARSQRDQLAQMLATAREAARDTTEPAEPTP